MRPLKNNSLSSYSGIDPESRKWLKILDSGFRRNDKRDVAMERFKGLTIGMSPSAGFPNKAMKTAKGYRIREPYGQYILWLLRKSTVKSNLAIKRGGEEIFAFVEAMIIKLIKKRCLR